MVPFFSLIYLYHLSVLTFNKGVLSVRDEWFYYINNLQELENPHFWVCKLFIQHFKFVFKVCLLVMIQWTCTGIWTIKLYSISIYYVTFPGNIFFVLVLVRLLNHVGTKLQRFLFTLLQRLEYFFWIVRFLYFWEKNTFSKPLDCASLLEDISHSYRSKAGPLESLELEVTN